MDLVTYPLPLCMQQMPADLTPSLVRSSGSVIQDEIRTFVEYTNAIFSRQDLSLYLLHFLHLALIFLSLLTLSNKTLPLPLSADFFICRVGFYFILRHLHLSCVNQAPHVCIFLCPYGLPFSAYFLSSFFIQYNYRMFLNSS